MTDPTTTNDTDTTPTMSNETLAALFRHATHFMARVYHMQGHARHAQSNILNILGQRNSMSQRELLEELNVRSASLSELLAKLERGGLITRERDEEDKRSFIITMTEQGKAAAASMDEDRPAGAEALFAPLSAEEKQQLGELLAKLLAALEDQHPEIARSPHHGHGRHGHGHHGREGRGRGCHGHGGHEHGDHEHGAHEHGPHGHHEHGRRHGRGDGPGGEAGHPERGPRRRPRE